MTSAGLRFLGAGVSGGEEGALKGPSIMPGGSREAYDDVEHVFTSIAAQVDGTPCCTYVGADGAGHYVKMVHNGIEYARHAADRRGLRPAAPRRRARGAGDRAGLRRVERGRPRLVPDRDHRAGARQGRRAHGQAAGRRDPRPGRAEGHRALDGAGRARARRAADRDHRGGVRALALGARRPARDGVGALAGPKPGEGAPPTASSSTTCARRSTPRRSSPTPRASSR